MLKWICNDIMDVSTHSAIPKAVDFTDIGIKKREKTNNNC